MRFPTAAVTSIVVGFFCSGAMGHQRQLNHRALAKRRGMDCFRRSVSTMNLVVLLAAPVLTAAFGLGLGPCIAFAQSPCDQPLFIEATIPYVAVSGPVQRVLVSGGSVWVMQGNMALRFRQGVGGTWETDSAFQHGSDPERFDARGDRILSGGTGFLRNPLSGAWVPWISFSLGLNESAWNLIGAKLGNSFIARSHTGEQNFYNWHLMPLLGGALSTAEPPGFGGTMKLRASSNRFAISHSINPIGKVSIYQVSGNDTSVAIAGFLAMPPLTLVEHYDFALSDSLVAIVYRDAPYDNRVQSVGVGGVWRSCNTLGDGAAFRPERVAVNEDSAYSYGSVGFAGNTILAEFVRTEAGSMQPSRQLPLAASGPIACGENFVATTVTDSASPSGHSLVIIRTKPSADCDGDGVLDCEEIGTGVEPDVNGNGVPDSCECIADFYADAQVNGVDLGVMLSEWGPSASAVADINRDGIVDGFDLGVVLGAWGPCP